MCLCDNEPIPTIPLWTPSAKTQPKKDNVILFLSEDHVKKAIRNFVKENYNLDISEIDFRKMSENIFVECTVEENE